MSGAFYWHHHPNGDIETANGLPVFRISKHVRQFDLEGWDTEEFYTLRENGELLDEFETEEEAIAAAKAAHDEYWENVASDPQSEAKRPQVATYGSIKVLRTTERNK